MIRYWAFFTALMFSLPAAAQSATDSEANVVVIPGQNTEQQTDEWLPLCDNEKIHELVLEKIAQYQQKNRADTIVEKRKQALILKQLSYFDEIDVAKFENAQNYRVADVLLMEKINRGLSDADIRLCRGSGNTNVYLVIFRDDNAYRVQIVNFVPLSEEKDFAVYYFPPRPEEENSLLPEGWEDDAQAENDSENQPESEEKLNK